MKLEPARYLLRFDDLCPTMSKQRFERFCQICERHQLRPILGVVPDNQDPELICDEPDPAFWDRMCALQSAGSVIAMHGYRHLCHSHGRSIVGLRSHSEFAGVPQDVQRHWVRTGLLLLRERGLDPKLFVAPRHGFDFTTLQILLEERLPFLSDGFAVRPYCRAGVFCIPQQLWAPIEKQHGLWTICIHTNTATDELARDLDRFLSLHAHQFTTFDQVAADGLPKTLSWWEELSEWILLNRRRAATHARQHSIKPDQ